MSRAYIHAGWAGFHALIHGIPLTVTGTPFYSGRGLTDDRAQPQGQRRKLTLEQLFCGAYLIHARYATALEGPVRNCLTAMLICGISKKRRLNKMLGASSFIFDRIESVTMSNYWPALFRTEHNSRLDVIATALAKPRAIQKILARTPSDHYRLSVSFFLLGKLNTTSSYGTLLEILRSALAPSEFFQITSALEQTSPSTGIRAFTAWDEGQHGHIKMAKGARQLDAQREGLDDRALTKAQVSLDQYPHILAEAQLALDQRDLTTATAHLYALLLSGHAEREVFYGLAEIAHLRFDFISSAEILRLYCCYVPADDKGRAYLLAANARMLCPETDGLLGLLLDAYYTNIAHIGSAYLVDSHLSRSFGPLPFWDALFTAITKQGRHSPIAITKALIALQRASEAETLLVEQPELTKYLAYQIELSRAYSYQGKIKEATELIDTLLPEYPNSAAYKEALRLAVIEGNYPRGATLLKTALALDLDVGDTLTRKIFLGSNNLADGYKSFRTMGSTALLKRYIGSKYFQSASDIQGSNGLQILILGFFGPGDEIRFASFYGRMVDICAPNSVTFTCDPRLQNLMAQGNSKLRLSPVRRTRSLVGLGESISCYRDLPGSDLHTVLDNNGWHMVSRADRVAFVTDFLGDVIEGYHSFSGKPYLAAHPEHIAHWRQQLSSFAQQRLIGISWRSSLATYARNEHYLDVQSLAPLFERRDLTFVNLQYDECSDDLAWVEKHFPGRLINFPELDQFNDLDGVAALMQCLDLVISPATTVAELAGALGRPTFMLSNSSELHWRKRPGTQQDVWYDSMTHIEGALLGNKHSLVESLVSAIQSSPSERFLPCAGLKAPEPI